MSAPATGPRRAGRWARQGVESATERPRAVPSASPPLVLRDLSVSYSGRPALRGVDLDIAAGQITALVGPSGCGKTTLLTVLNRLSDLVPGCAVSGQVRLADLEVLARDVDLIALRRRVGMIFQKPNPFPLSIRQNIAFPLREHGVRDKGEVARRVEEALRDVGLWDEIADRLDAPARRLSGGQQQRLCLARALALRPEVLLLDEPCSALDPVGSAVVEELIQGLRGRYTIVLVTHNLAQARRIADDVALFWVEEGAGKLVEHGPVEQMFGSPAHELTRGYMRGSLG